MIRFLIYICLIISTFNVPVIAFEVDEFRSGMSIHEALQIARRYDISIKPLQSDPYTYISIPRLENTGRVWQFTFCKEKLVGLDTSYPFSWARAAELTFEFNRRYGEGTVKPHKHEISGELAAKFLADTDMHKNDDKSSSMNTDAASLWERGIVLSWDNEAEWVVVIMSRTRMNLGNTAREQIRDSIIELHKSRIYNESCSGQ